MVKGYEGPFYHAWGQKHDLVADVLLKSTAPEDGKPCVTYIGPDGAGMLCENGPQRLSEM